MDPEHSLIKRPHPIVCSSSLVEWLEPLDYGADGHRFQSQMRHHSYAMPMIGWIFNTHCPGAVCPCGYKALGTFIFFCCCCKSYSIFLFQGSPGRHPVPDLWVNANAEVSLTPLDQRRDIALTDREALGGQRLSGMGKGWVFLIIHLYR